MRQVRDWFRPIVLLSVTAVGGLVLTLGLVAILIPRGIGGAADASRPPESSSDPGGTSAPIGVGGTLRVTGDREDTVDLSEESMDVVQGMDNGRYGLVGDGGHIYFSRDPLAVEYVNAAGLSFFPDADQCEISPGTLNAVIGVAEAHITCTGLEDVRKNGTVNLEGTVAMAADVLGMRDDLDLPSTGGQLVVGERRLDFAQATVTLSVRSSRISLPIYADDGSGLILEFDSERYELFVGQVLLDDVFVDIDDDACALVPEELGLLNPRTVVLDVSIRCDSVTVPSLGSVSVKGQLFIDAFRTEDLLLQLASP